MKPTDMTPRLSCTYTGDQPDEEECTCSEAIPRMVGIDGPQMSTSIMPVYPSRSVQVSTETTHVGHTCVSSSAANAQPNCAVNVDLPTPPLPESTSILCFTLSMRWRTSGRAGSGPRVTPDAHISWFAHPAQASALPACSDCVPCGTVSVGQRATGDRSTYRTVLGSIRWNHGVGGRRERRGLLHGDHGGGGEMRRVELRRVESIIHLAQSRVSAFVIRI